MNNPLFNKTEKKFETSSLSLLRANPKLSGNIKIVVDSLGDAYLSTLEFVDGLSDANKLKYPINPNEPLNLTIKNFIKNSRIDKESLYTNFRKKTDLSISNDFYNFYDDGYLAGVKYKDSLQYSEKLSAFYPIFLRKNAIPSHFFIFKANGPFSNGGNFENFNTTNVQSWINDFRIIKTFDLTENSKIGKLLRDLTKLKTWTDDCFNFSTSGSCEYKGISLDNGTLTGVYENLSADFFTIDKICLERNDIVTRGFYRNNLICANTINLEFLFDDNINGSIDRYFGIFADFDEISEFYIDAQRAKNAFDITDLNIWNPLNASDRFLNFENLRIFTDSQTNLIEPTELQNNKFWTVKSSKNNFYSVSNNAWTLQNNDNLDIVLKNNEINVNDFVNYKVFDETIIVDKKFNHNSLPSLRFDMVKVPNDGDAIRIRYTNILADDFNEFADNHTFVANSTLSQGTSIANTFSNVGNIETVCNALINCINKSNENFSTGYTLLSLGSGKLLLLSRVQSLVRNNIFVEFYTNDNIKKFEFFENFEISNVFSFLQSPINLGAFTSVGTLTSCKMVGAFSQNCVKIKRSFLNLLKSIDKPYFQKENNFFESFEIFSITNPKICQYTENIKQNALGEFIYPNESEYILLLFDIKLPSSQKLQIYKRLPNYVGLLSLYHIVDFDNDLENSIYSKEFVSNRQELQNFLISGSVNSFTTTYPTPINNPTIIETVYNDDSEFVLNGEFFKLSDFSKDSETYKSEYDRLQEEFLKETAIVSKTSQWIARWSSRYLNARSVEYGLKTSKAFGATNFTPSFKEFSINPKFLTHDWLLLCGIPPYFTQNDLENCFDRILTVPNFNDFLNFDNFFKLNLERKFINNLEIPELSLYSEIRKNNDEYSTMFRGVFLQPFKKANLKKIDNNIDDIEISNFEFDNYKFAAILLPSVSGYKIKIARNDIEKSILLCCECDLFDDVSNRYTDGIDTFTYIDRVQLYTNFSKYRYDFSNDLVYSDVLISGSIERWSVSNTGVFTFFGNINLNNQTFPDFENEIYPNNAGTFDKIVITSGADILEITNIVKLSSTTIQALNFTLNGLPILVSSSILSISMTYGYITTALRTAVYTYKNGGYNANLRILDKTSFANIATLINEGNEKIEYVAKLKNGQIVENDFFIKLIEPSQITTNTYLEVFEDDRPAVLRNTYEPIGFKILSRNSTTSEIMSAYGCSMSPLFKKLLNFSIDFDNSAFANLYNRNTKIYESIANFLIYYNKISVNLNARILSSTANDFLPLYPKIFEVPVAKRFLNPFISSFDYGFYLENLDKSNVVKRFGTLSKKINKSIFASVVPISTDFITLTNFSAIVTNGNVLFENRNINDRDELQIWQYIDGVVCSFDIDKLLVNVLKTQFLNSFTKYIVGDVLADIVTRFGSLEIYLNEFLFSEILPRYEVSQVILYKRTATNVITNNLLESFELSTTEQFKKSTMNVATSSIEFRGFEKRNFDLNIKNFEFFNNVFSFVVKTALR